MLFRGLDEVEGFPLSTQIIDNVTVMIWHPEYGLIYLEARPEFELIKKEPVQILPEDEDVYKRQMPQAMKIAVPAETIPQEK